MRQPGRRRGGAGRRGPNWNNILTGTPTQAGTFSFTIQVTDSLTNFANTTLTITIGP